MMRHVLAVSLGVALTSCAQAPSTPAAAQEPRPDPLPGTKLSDRSEGADVSCQRRQRLKRSWPNGARVAVGLSFDVDNATATLSTGKLDLRVISRGEYGAVDGVPRILRMLERQVPASLFIPAVSDVLHPQMVRDIQSGRHEIGVHGWIHERLPSSTTKRRSSAC